MLERMCRYSIVFAALTVPLASCDQPAPEETSTVRPVRAIELVSGVEFGKLWFPGQARATQETALSFRVAGPLIEFPVDIGDKVATGDVIARIDPSTFIVDVNAARAALARADSEAKNAAAQLVRQRQLNQRGHTSRAALDEHIAAAGIANAAVAVQQAVLERAQLELSFTELRAPFSGEVSAKFVENFEDVRAKQQIVRLVDKSRIEMVVQLPETLISFAPSVPSVEVVFDAFPDVVLKATIKEIGTEASQTTRTYPVTIIMDQPEAAEILPGMAGRATPTEVPSTQWDGQQLLVPDTAVFAGGDSDAQFVWILDRELGTVSRRRVFLGQLTRFGYVAAEGLAPGEWVVTAGVHHLEEGQHVELLND